MPRANLTRYAWLAIAAAIVTIGLKLAAYWLTGSVGLLSDAVESFVNLAAGIIALWVLSIAARPADEEHLYGHSRAEYFASGVEGGLILIAAVSIIVSAIPRLINPTPLEQTGLGLVITAVASSINFVVAQILLRAGRRHTSIALEADGRHLMTDVWTSIGVILGVALVSITGWLRLDPLIALAVAANIIWAGYHLIRRSILGLMDTALPPDGQQKLRNVLAGYEAQGVQFHAVRTRQAAARSFISMHVLVPGDWTVQHGHDLLERIEVDVMHALPDATVFTHIEPQDDPTAFDDIDLDRRPQTLNPTP